MRLFGFWLGLVAGVVPALLALPVQAQESTVFRDEIEVWLAEIEVVVTDADGQAVTGLTRDDFEVRQGRKRLAVTHFTAFEDGRRIDTGSGGGSSEIPEPPRTADDRLHLVLYIDHAYMEPGELGDVARALRGFLADAPRPKDRVMLVEANHSLDIVHRFTAVPELIIDELLRLEPRSPRGRVSSEFPRLLREIERVAERGSGVRNLNRDEPPMVIKSQIDSYVAQVHRELSQATHQLHRLIPALAGLPGRKVILYIGGAMPSDAGRRLYSAWRTAFGPSSSYQQQSSPSGRDADFGRLVNTTPEMAAKEAETNELFRQVADRANASGVKLHVLDSGGLRRASSFITSRGATAGEQSGSAASGDLSDTSRRLGDPKILRMMAETTGGRALTHSRDFQTALASVARDLSTYYTLAFRPRKADGELHEIRVKLEGKRRGLTVRHRQAYRSLDLDRVAVQKVVSALILGEVDDPLGIELAAEPPKPIAGRRDLVRLPLRIIFPVAKLALVPDPGGHRGQVSIYLTSGDLEQGAGEVQKTVVPLRFTDGELQDALKRNIEYKLELPMAAGSRKVAIAFRDDLRPLSATVVLRLGA